MNCDIIRKLAQIADSGERAVLCMVTEASGSVPGTPGASMIVHRDGKIDGTVGGGIAEHRVIEKALEMMEGPSEPFLMGCDLSDSERGTEGAVCGGSLRVYMEVLGGDRELLIFGAGHVGKALARLGHITGLSVTVWDEREDFANGQNIPWGRTLCCPLSEFQEKGPAISGATSVVIVTRGHSLDGDVVKILEKENPGYMGMIGSRSKIASIRERLLKEGVSEKHLDRIRQPIGLPIGAKTPEEIAVSVMAEIIGSYRKGNLEELRRGWEKFKPTSNA